MVNNQCFSLVLDEVLGSLSSDVFEPRTSTGSGLFAVLSRQFEQIFGQILSIRVKLRSNTILVPWRYIKRGTGSLPVDLRRSRTSLFKLPNESNTRRSNLVRKTHSICFDWMVTSQDFLLAHYFLTVFFVYHFRIPTVRQYIQHLSAETLWEWV